MNLRGNTNDFPREVRCFSAESQILSRALLKLSRAVIKLSRALFAFTRVAIYTKCFEVQTNKLYPSPTPLNILHVGITLHWWGLYIYNKVARTDSPHPPHFLSLLKELTILWCSILRLDTMVWNGRLGCSCSMYIGREELRWRWLVCGRGRRVWR